MKTYKYLGRNAAECFLKDQTLRITQPKALNDPFELQPEFIVNDETLLEGMEFSCKFVLNENVSSYEKYLIKGNSLAARTKKLDNRKLISRLSEQIGILCLTRADTLLPVNLLMWAHYAESHQGIVVELKTNCDFIKSGKEVHYVPRRPIIDAKIFLENETVSIDDLYFKSDEWFYENELRLTKILSDCTETGKKDSLGYYVYLCGVPIDSIECIYIGCNASESLKTASLRLHQNVGIKVMYLRAHDEEYKLVPYASHGLNYPDVFGLSEQLLYERKKI
ncbi:DUF2971 domain-containing protein [Desulfobacula sp.]|uniref:DUF2971 domain-containing protein n=1 Tax=Desulfobacula sp. TaxID=2593537 RepID=UPI00262F46EF|nr:DUF2971 domain-containing protein [Desulfobacula sp.]